MQYDSGGNAMPMEFAEFLERADRIYDERKPATLWALKDDLVRLAANTGWVMGEIQRVLTGRLASQFIIEQPTYFVLHRGGKFSLRVTVWFPEHQQVSIKRVENWVFAYDYPHNHNFDLLTTTVAGPGYATQLYGIEFPSEGLRIGNRIAAADAGIVTLSPGSALFYEAGVDVHSQIPVSEVSVALNLIPKSDRYKHIAQYGFVDYRDGSIAMAGFPLSPTAQEQGAVRVLGKLAGCGIISADFVGQIAAGHRSDAVRAYGREVLRSLANGAEDFDRVIFDEIQDGYVASNYADVAAKVSTRRQVVGCAALDPAAASLGPD